MAGRPNKIGLDYFELDCLLDDDIKLIQAEFGLKGFAVVVKLYQKIYGGSGYYCEWNEDVLLLFMSENFVSSDSKNLINDIVSACVRRNIFSKQLFDKYHILTSHGIQKRYLNATSKRERVEMKKEYLLISVGKNNNNVSINSINDGINSIKVVSNTQSRVEESKEDKSKEIHIVHSDEVHNACSLNDFYEKIWKLCPIKKGKGQVSKTKKQVLQKIGYEQIERCVERFISDMESEKRDKKYWMHGSTFLNSGYIDYLDCNCTSDNVHKDSENSLENDRFSTMDQEKIREFENSGIIIGQSLNLGNATKEQVEYLKEHGVL